MLITAIANDKRSYIGRSPDGVIWYSATVKVTGIYVYAKDGVIKGVGYNTKARDIAKDKNLTK